MASDRDLILLKRTDLIRKFEANNMIQYCCVDDNHIRVLFHRTPVSFCDIFICPDVYRVEYNQWFNRNTAFFNTAAGVETVLVRSMKVATYMEICQKHIDGPATAGLCDSDPKPLHAVARILTHRHVHWRRGSLPSIVIFKDGERAGLVVRWEDDKYKLNRTPSPNHGEPYDIEYGLACSVCDAIEKFLTGDYIPFVVAKNDDKPSVVPYGAYDKLKKHFFKHAGYKYITTDLVKIEDPPFTIDNKLHLSVSYLSIPVCDIRCDVLENDRCGYMVSFTEPFLLPTGYKPYKDTNNLVAFPYTDKSLYDMVSMLGCINISIDGFNQRLSQYRVNMLQAIKGILLSKKYENISFYEFESPTTNDGIKICHRGQSVCSIVAETELSKGVSNNNWVCGIYRVTYYTPFDQLRAVGNTITFSHVAHVVGNTRDNLRKIAMDVLKDIDDCISLINKEEKDNMASGEVPVVSNTLNDLYTRVRHSTNPNLEVRTYLNSARSGNSRWMNIFHNGVKLFEAFGKVSWSTKDDLLVVCYDPNNTDTACFRDSKDAMDWIVEKTAKYDENNVDKLDKLHNLIEDSRWSIYDYDGRRLTMKCGVDTNMMVIDVYYTNMYGNALECINWETGERTVWDSYNALFDYIDKVFKKKNEEFKEEDHGKYIVSVPNKIKTGKMIFYPGRCNGKTAIWAEMCKHLAGYLKIENVIFSEPATIVFWGDGTKTVVKAQNEDFDPEKGLAMAISKKVYGNDRGYYKPFLKWINKYNKQKLKKSLEAAKKAASDPDEVTINGVKYAKIDTSAVRIISEGNEVIKPYCDVQVTVRDGQIEETSITPEQAKDLGVLPKGVENDEV